VIPVNPQCKEVLRAEGAHRCAFRIPEKSDLVDVFHKTADVLPVAEDAIAIGARVFWQQLGVRNEEAGRPGPPEGLEPSWTAVKIEHGRPFGGLNSGWGQYPGDLGEGPACWRTSSA
jgi:hypothetical protein